MHVGRVNTERRLWQCARLGAESCDGTGFFRGDPVQLWFLDLAEGSARRLTNDNDDYREFQSSGDGSFIVAATWKEAENLFLAPAENPSEITQLTFDIAANNGAWGMAWRWRPDPQNVYGKDRCEVCSLAFTSRLHRREG